ncbi:MAG: DUF4351 domain-containing protein [Pseudanabaena sp. LacPavin_0818_WC45_MAG_42_6]|nr:DUF4351 domain-containing protein [Pseudanabaena sp. LacPavin_0818_WC45_MAG_42_6]
MSHFEILCLSTLSRLFCTTKVNPRLKPQISKLSVTQIENLAEAIFDFATVADLNTWLKNQS